MSEPMFLSAEDVVQLTGRARRDAQVRVLRSMGIDHKIRPDGSPLVLRQHVYAVLGGLPGATAKHADEPNWEML